MKCADCRRPLTGAEALRRAEFRAQPGGAIKVFGVSMPDGPLALASGQLVQVKHNGCYYAAKKREQRAAR